MPPVLLPASEGVALCGRVGLSSTAAAPTGQPGRKHDVKMTVLQTLGIVLKTFPNAKSRAGELYVVKKKYNTGFGTLTRTIYSIFTPLFTARNPCDCRILYMTRIYSLQTSPVGLTVAEVV